MTLSVFYRASFFISLALAWLSVLLGANVPGFMWALVPAFIAVETLHVLGRHAPPAVVTLIGLASLAVGAFWLAAFGLGQVVMAAVLSLSGILIARLSRRQTPGHDQQAIVLGLLLMLAGSVLHTSVSYGLVFVAYAITTAWALVSRQLVTGCLREAERLSDDETKQATISTQLMSRRDIASPRFILGTAALASLLLAAASLVFALFPRIGLSNLSFLSRPAPRFPPNVSLSGGPRGGIGGPVMARVRGLSEGQFDDGLYLRGPVYDAATPQGFERSGDRETLSPVFSQLSSSERRQRYQVFMQPVLDSVMLSLGSVERAWGIRGGQANPNVDAGVIGVLGDGELHAGRPLKSPLSYEVLGAVVGSGQGSKPRSLPKSRLSAMLTRYTQVPELGSRIKELAESIRTSTTDEPEAIAETLREYLQTNYRYTLEAENESSAPLETFLFESKAGHCEFFATALALLLRLNEIPSRVVGGFQGGQWDSEDRVVVFNRGHAHAWVEWWSAKKGWQIIDATPGSAGERRLSGLALWQERVARWWDQNVVEFGAHQQIAALASAAKTLRSPYRKLSTSVVPSVRLGIALGFVGALLLAVLVVTLVRRRRGRDPSDILTRYFTSRLGRAPYPAETYRQLHRTCLKEFPRPTDEELLVDTTIGEYEAAVFGCGKRQDALSAAMRLPN